MILPQQQEFPSILQLQEINLLIAKYDSMLNYIKQYNLIVSVCIKDPKNSTKVMLNTLLIQFDRCVEQYCLYYMNMRLKHAIYFIIDPLAFQRNKSNLNRVYYQKGGNSNSLDQVDFKNGNIKFQNFENEHFLLRLVFVKDEAQRYNVKYKMHAEIWKKNGINVETNEILTMFEEQFMMDLANKLYLQGFVTHFSRNHGVNLVYKKSKITYSSPSYFNNTKSLKSKQNIENSSFLFEFLEFACKKYIQIITEIFKNKLSCAVCSRNLMYDHRKNIFVPPTVKIQPFLEKSDIKMLHEQCCIKYLIPVSPLKKYNQGSNSKEKDQQRSKTEEKTNV